MKYKEMDWKAWLAIILIVAIIGGIASGMRASAESTTPTDLPVVDDEETYWLDEVEGGVILDAPAYFMDIEEEPTLSDEEEEISLADVLGNDESTTEPVASPEDNTEQRSDKSADDTPDAPDTPTTDDSVTDPTETPDTPVDEPTTEPTTEPTDTPTEQLAETLEQPEETEQPPVDLKTLFDVSIKVPSGWRNSYSATVRIKITPSGDQMWHKVRYCIGDEEWETIPNKDFVLYDGYYYTDIEVYYNAKMSVRLFGDEETYFDTNKEISIFDHYAPEVTAGFRDLVLHVEAVDDVSEVAGIQVNSLLFTTLVDGVLDVRMEEPLLGYKQLAVRAYDYAGNFSDPVTLDNPYYVEPRPEPTNTPKPTAKPTKKPSTTKKPTSGSSTAKPTATPVATATPVVTTAPQQQIVYVTPDPNMYSYYQPQVTAEPETVYVPLGPGQPYKSEGNMQTLDMLYQGSEVQDLKPYLAGIAQKRLEAFEGIPLSSEISDILGEKEDLDSECQRIVAGRKRHLYDILKTNSRLSSNQEDCDKIIEIISASDNVIAVSLCALWVARNTEEDLIQAAHSAASAMNAYLNKTDDPLRDKFKSDYDKSPWGSAMEYLKSQKTSLLNYLLDGRLKISNNCAECSIKPFVIDRKNFLFTNTPGGAQGSAVIFSLIQTAIENGLDPWRYLTWLIDMAAKGSVDAEGLFPWVDPVSCRGAV